MKKAINQITLVGIVALFLCCGLVGADDLPEDPSFLQYYTPVDLEIEPNAPGYELPLETESITNWSALDSVLDLKDAESLICENGFAVLERDTDDPNRDDMAQPYRWLKSQDIPLFVSIDTWLHLYHIQFDETLRDVEENEFIGDMTDLTQTLQADLWQTLLLSDFADPNFYEALRRNLAYVSVAYKLLVPDTNVPAVVQTEVAGELAKIEAHEGYAESDLFIYKEDYSQYVPRGHYTRSAALQRYFKAMMWVGRMAFLLKGDEDWGPNGEALVSVQDARIQTIQAVQLAEALRDAEVGKRSGLEIWDRLYTVTAFYVGVADDLTPYDYLWALDRVLNDGGLDEDTILAVKAELATLPSPEIYGGTGDVLVPDPITDESLNDILDKTKGMRLMGQRFIPDSYMFQHLVFPEVMEYQGQMSESLPFTAGYDGAGTTRGYPRGLDVMAVLGSQSALTTLIQAGDTDFEDYWLRFGELRSEYDALTSTDWHANLYYGWLYALKALLPQLESGYPNFMRTAAWQKHQLNSALASWTELRHDTILYAKQSYTAGRTSVPSPQPAGYLEPQAEFLKRLLELNRMTQQGLGDLEVLSSTAQERLETLDQLLSRALEITELHLANEPLTADDESFILDLAASLDQAVSDVDDAGVTTALVADVHTNTTEEKVLEEATGKLDLMVVACPASDGTVFLAVGPVLSTYEFKHPMSDRLTDEAWREMLDSEDCPDRPEWYEEVMAP